MTHKKRLEISVILGLIFTIMLSYIGFDASCSEIKNNVLRIHILANSDSNADQELKLKVRDELVVLSERLFKTAQSKQDAEKIVSDNLTLFLETAKGVISREGYDYEVEAKVGKNHFDTRVYENFTLPAGEYDSLIIKIGKAEGKNWWCVLFPSICVSASSDFHDDISEKSEKIITQPQEYTVKFKVVEIIENARQKINSIFF